MSEYSKWYVKYRGKVIDIYPGHARLDINANVALREKYAYAMGVSRASISICQKNEV